MSNHSHVSPLTSESPRHHSHYGVTEDMRFGLLDYWRSIVKRKVSIFAFALAVAALATLISFIITPVYQATTTLLIEASRPKVVSVEEVYSGMSANREYFQTQSEIIQSRDVALRVIKALKLWDHAEFNPRKEPTWWSGFIKWGEPKPTEPWTEERLAEAVYPQFAQQLDVQLVRMSQLVKIRFQATDKQLAARVANTVAEQYIESDREARFIMAQNALSWLNNQMTGLRKKLDDSERALQHYREAHGLIALKADGQGGIGAQLNDVTTMLVSARARRAEAENAYRQAKSVTNGDYSSIPAVVSNPLVLEAKRQEAEAERKVSELAQRYGPAHPKMIQAEGELKTMRQITKRQIDTVIASLTQSYDVARGTERSLEQTLAQAKGSVIALNRKEAELSVLEREAASNKQLFEMFMNRTKETSAAQDLQAAVARIVDPARVADHPVKPKKGLIVTIATLLAMIVGALIALLLDRLDNRINSIDDVEIHLHYPALAGVPLLSAESSHQAGLLVERAPQSIYAEAIFTARTSVLLSSIDTVCRTLLVTSSVPGEGKTTFSIGLALSLARTRKTLLIDADMRRPGVAKQLGLELTTKGLSNFVAGTAPLKECLHVFNTTNLHYILAGDLPPNPLELLLSERFKETLRRLAEIYEVILIDSPPVGLVSDALVIAPLCTNTLFMVKADATPYPLVRKNLRHLAATGGTILGVVLSHLDYARAERYYGQSSAYGKYGYARYGGTYGTYGGKTYGS